MVLTVLALLLVVPAQRVTAQEAEAAPSDAGSEAGLGTYTGGVVKGKKALTQTTGTTFPESGTVWLTLPAASLSFTVPATPAGGDLLNVAFSAECSLTGSVTGDYLRIRISDTVGAATTYLEPYDGNQVFCSATARGGTFKGNWVKRALAGTHTLRVQFQIVDGAPAGVVTATIDDWTFEAVAYE